MRARKNHDRSMYPIDVVASNEVRLGGYKGMGLCPDRVLPSPQNNFWKALSCDTTNRTQTTAIKQMRGGPGHLERPISRQHNPERWRRLIDW